MATLLAECDDCGKAFVAGEVGGGKFALGSQDVYIESMQINRGEVTLGNVEVGSCPWCGGTGRIPQGTYDVLAGTVTTLHRLGPDKQLWLIKTLKELTTELPPTAEKVGEILSEVPSEARSVLSTILAGERWKYWLPILIAILAILIQHRDAQIAVDTAHHDAGRQIQQAQDEARDGESQLHAEVNRLVEAILADNAGSTTTTASSTNPKMGRNQPCWCGSGNKFKRCHGR